MNLLTLTDNTLALFHRQAANEIARRAKVATNGHDAASIIHGNEMAKRAVVVAAAGNHSILFIGPPNCGKTMLRAVALELGLGTTFEARPCPCGYRNDPRRACQCGYKQIERHLRKWPVADISIETVSPAERERRSPGTSVAEMRQQIEAKTSYESLELGDDSRNLLKAAAAAVSDGSYCTQLKATLPREQLEKAAQFILDQMFGDINSQNRCKRLMEEMSWLDESKFAPAR